MLSPRLQATYALAISGAELQSPAQFGGEIPLKHWNPVACNSTMFIIRGFSTKRSIVKILVLQ